VNHADLCAQRDLLLARASSAREALDSNLSAAGGDEARNAFVSLDAEGARDAARQADEAIAQGRDPGALAGLAVSVKDLFDVRGQPTRAGARCRDGIAAAAADAPVVARLRAAGAALIGRTQMTEFAFSGVGINPHDGTPANVALARLGRPDCVPGGSTAGGVVSVASGAAWAALGSDTGGSIRIPAALQGLVGYKNTQALTPTAGSVPLAPSLDTACAITRSVRDAVVLHQVLAQRTVTLAGRPLHRLRLAWCPQLFQDALEPVVAAAFEASLAALSAGGASVTTLDLPMLEELPELTRDGGITCAEAWAWHAPQLPAHADAYDPRVLSRIRRGAAVTPERLAALHAHRRRWIGAMNAALSGVDAVLSPTVPLIAPPLAPLRADDDAFFAVNALLLRNPAIVNLLDGCAISLPCQPTRQAPVGLMLWAPGGRDDALLDAALAVEAALRPVRGLAPEPTADRGR
jgi:amidase/aspartyl-tRNA(Asn)/glutamyl-tRNA(Gln) amidotransferase subunit A